MLNSIGNYNLIREISSGGMATVYLAINTQNNVKVAIKILHERLLSTEKIYERFKQEGFFKLDHPNIVKILDAGIHESSPYIVMEYMEGQDLEELIRQKGKLDIGTALDIFTQILSALSYVHLKGIIHRDIKPKNILINKSGTAKLTDFGIAKSLYSHVKTSTGGYLGAPAYSSPEQMDGKGVDERSDIYSLGITLYEMLTGTIPYSSTSLDVIVKEKFSDNLIPITKYRTYIPENIISILSKCIAKNPSDRFGSVGEIIKALKEKKDNDETTVEFVKKEQRVNKAAITFGILCLVLFIVLIAVFVNYVDDSNKLITAIESLKAENASNSIKMQQELEQTKTNLSDKESKLVNTESELERIRKLGENIPANNVVFDLYSSSAELENSTIQNINGEDLFNITIDKVKGGNINYYASVFISITAINNYDSSPILILVSTNNLIATDTNKSYIETLKSDFGDASIEVAINNKSYYLEKYERNFEVFIASLKIRNWWWESMVIEINLK